MMRHMDRDAVNVQKVLPIHCEYVVENVRKETMIVQEELYYKVKTLMDGKECNIKDEAEFEDDTWIKNFISADVEKMRWMVNNHMDAMLHRRFRQMYEMQFVKANRGEYSPVQMVNGLGIKVCPYCDRNYINNVWREMDGKALRGNQLDHFFPKGKFPMLSMCFYNLIPVCSSCNLHKHEKLFSMNPYEAGIEEQTFFDVQVNGKLEEDNMKVNLLYTSEIKQNIELLALKELYNEHADIAYEIVAKSVYYDRTKKYELCKNYPQLFHTIEDVDRILYGMDFKDLNKRPLQKFYNDILKIYKS